MTSLAYTPDLFADQPPAAPRCGVSQGPTFTHPVRGEEERWRRGWFRHIGMKCEFTPYDPSVIAWVRHQLAGGPKEYGELLNARRRAGIEHPFEVAEPIRAHVRYLVMAGEVIEHKRYLGHPDASNPGYRGWHPVLELAGDEEEPEKAGRKG